jgi:hypothetical protein
MGAISNSNPHTRSFQKRAVSPKRENHTMQTIIIEFQVRDIDEATKALAENADLLADLSKEARDRGCRHHAFYSDVETLYVIDEWDSAANFISFFDGNQKIRSIMEQAGVRLPPKVTVLTRLETSDVI